MMPEVTCAERTSDTPNAQDAVWVQNGQGNKLYYPYVSSCVTVTLVFQNGVLGGHASQGTPVKVGSKLQPAKNLLDVIARMAAAAPDANMRGAFKKIYYIGTSNDTGWDLNAATNDIIRRFGSPNTTPPTEYPLTPVDIVFDAEARKLYVVGGIKKAQGASETIRIGAQSEAEEGF
jgi:hypothetical protein